MKRYDKDFRDEGQKRPFRPRSEGPSYGRSEAPRFGASRGREGSSYGGGGGGGSNGGGYGEQRAPRGDSREFDRPRRSEGFGDRPQRSTFRRDGGPSSGYGHPPSREGNRRYDEGAPQRPERAQRPERTERAAAPARAMLSASQLKAGVRQANRALAEVIEQFGSTIEGGYDISELEVSVSFGDDGKFLGFGKGGALSMTLSITPLDGESLVDVDEEPQMEMDESMQAAAADFANFESKKKGVNAAPPADADVEEDDDDEDDDEDDLDDLVDESSNDADDSDGDSDVEVRVAAEASSDKQARPAKNKGQAESSSHNDDIEA